MPFSHRDEPLSRLRQFSQRSASLASWDQGDKVSNAHHAHSRHAESMAAIYGGSGGARNIRCNTVDRDLIEEYTGGRDKLRYQPSHRGHASVEFHEDLTSEATQHAKNMAKRINMQFSDECFEAKRKARKIDRLTKNILDNDIDSIECGKYDSIKAFNSKPYQLSEAEIIAEIKKFESSPHQPKSNKTGNYQAYFVSMNGRRPNKNISKSNERNKKTTDKYWWQDAAVDSGRTRNPNKVTTDTLYERRKRIQDNLEDIILFDKPIPSSNHTNLQAYNALHNDNSSGNRKSHDTKHNNFNIYTKPVDADSDSLKRESAEDRVNRRAEQITNKLQHLRIEKNDHETHNYGRKSLAADPNYELYNYSPQTTQGYSNGMTQNDGSETAELRGRLRRLICRTKSNPHYYRF